MRDRRVSVVYLLVLLFFSLSCTKKQIHVAHLDLATQQMESHPDSALLVLQSIKNPHKLSPEQYAMYCLLVTEAEDKTYIVHTSDSLISVAAHYFEHEEDDFIKAKAWYYMGRVNQDILQPEKAIDYYLKAIPYAEATKQNLLLSRIYSQTSMLYRQQLMVDNAILFAQKAYDFSVLSKDTVVIAYALRDIGRTYIYSDQVGMAINYYEKALALAKENKNNSVQVDILSDMSVAYEYSSNYPKALEVNYRAISLTDNAKEQATNYLSLGSLYLKMNELDSADYCLTLAYDSDDAYVKAGSSYYLYLLSKEQHGFEDALSYYESYQNKKAETEQKEQKDEILKLTHQYEQRELKKEMELQTVRERFFYSSCILFLLIVIIVSYFLYMRYRWSRERLIRLKEKQIQYEKELRLMSENQIRNNIEQIEQNRQKLINKEEALQSVQRNLLNYNTKLLKAENELITLRREEYAFRNKLFEQTGIGERIRIAGTDFRKIDSVQKPFSARNFPELVTALNEIYDNFDFRLQATYPQLKYRELEICYLVKAGAKTSNIADIIAMTPNAVTKKKRLILDKMEIIDKDASLEEFLAAF